MPILGLLHTTEAHRVPFEALVGELAPEVEVRTLVDEELLAVAREHGPGSPAAIDRLERAIDQLEADGAGLVLCTCSTVGARAEAAGPHHSRPTMRIDRPMAEAAVRTPAGDGRTTRILVVATVDSTLDPTLKLLTDAAEAAGANTRVRGLLVRGAWELFEAGDEQAYLARIAEAIDHRAGHHDVIVLAQATMAPAADLVLTDARVLSSPVTGVRAAVARLSGSDAFHSPTP